MEAKAEVGLEAVGLEEEGLEEEGMEVEEMEEGMKVVGRVEAGWVEEELNSKVWMNATYITAWSSPTCLMLALATIPQFATTLACQYMLAM